MCLVFMLLLALDRPSEQRPALGGGALLGQRGEGGRLRGGLGGGALPRPTGLVHPQGCADKDYGSILVNTPLNTSKS